MSAPEIVHQLVEKFQQHNAEYQQHKNETELRREFLDPFLEALGWDVSNRNSYSERYKEVVHEQSVEVEGRAKAADYAFRVGEKTVFLLEAKKPSVKIETNPEPAFQLRRYGWSLKLAISLLSDFEQLAVYDCRVGKPNISDKPSLGRIKLYHYSQYVEKWDEIAALFSREAVLQGALEQFAETQKGKKGTTEVDDAFLQEIEGWRATLARNLALRNPQLIRNERDLNYVVQMTIDRIIFLRICEDRGIEPDEQLHEIAKAKAIYAELLTLFKRADGKYNSGLFHLTDDRLALDLQVDDKTLKEILNSLYYPVSPYVFNYISADILGQVYEQFLGKVIRLTAGHQAKVEEKPEVRKAGGVYYTPRYIVEYIVRNTVGKLLEGKTPEEAAKLKVLDPACGSGSFLLGAYQYLLDWYLKCYSEDEPAKWARSKNPPVFQGLEGWQLTLEKKREILTHHIYGVDIDAQAVEVTKLSLLLKMVENPGQLSFMGGRLLPDLDDNIKCGNSLIGPDYYDGRQMPMFGDEEFYRVNVFDWRRAFPQVFAAGGFDAVIGNPPYIRSQSLGADQRDYYNRHYKTSTGTYDIYVLFVEKSISLVGKDGKCGFILPNKFFTTDYGEGLRKLLAGNSLIESIVDFEDAQVFAGAGTYTNLLFLSNNPDQTAQYTGLGNIFKESGSIGLENLLSNSKIPFSPIELTQDGSRWTLASGESGSVLLRLQQSFPPFLSFEPHLFQGLKTSADKIFMLKINSRNGNECHATNLLGSEFVIEYDILKPVVKGEDVRRFITDTSSNLFILYPYKVEQNRKATIIDEIEMKTRFPKAWEYLNHHRKILGARDNNIWEKRKDWYAYARAQNISTFLSSKFLVPYMTTRLRVNLDDTGTLFFVNITTGGYGLRVKTNENTQYVLGLLNSKLLDYCIKQMTNRFRGGYFAVNKQAIERLPYRPINFSNPTEKAAHDRLVALVESMLALHKQLPSARTPQEKEMLTRQIEATDGQIDRLVYGLYGLTDDEIAVVEGK